MATRTVAVRKIKFTNPYKQWVRTYRKNTGYLLEMEMAFTYRRARSIMKKGPKKPKSRYGQEKTRKTGKRIGTKYWQKGQYSRPGQPPFHYGKQFDLRFIVWDKINPGSLSAVRPARKQQGAKVTAQRIGPKFNPQLAKYTPKPTPGLQEYGGTVKLNKRSARYRQRGTTKFYFVRKNGAKGSASYPERPFMRPAAKEARESVAKKMGSYKRLVNMFGRNGPKGRRKY